MTFGHVGTSSLLLHMPALTVLLSWLRNWQQKGARVGRGSATELWAASGCASDSLSQQRGWHYGDKQFTPPHPSSHSLTWKHKVLWDLQWASCSCSAMACTLPTASLGHPLRSGWVLPFNCHSKTFGHTPKQGGLPTSRVMMLWSHKNFNILERTHPGWHC